MLPVFGPVVADLISEVAAEESSYLFGSRLLAIEEPAVSVLVNTEDIIYFLAGDTSYSESLLIERTPDGVSPQPSVAVDTMNRILRLAHSRPLVYLPTHDPESVDRLTHKRTLGGSLMRPTVGGGPYA